MKTIHGDLIQLALDGEFDVIIHGCNCQCTMGAGIARSIKNTFPEAFQADMETTKGDRDKLGTISTATMERNGNTITIVNGYTQFHWRGSGVFVDYDAIRDVFAAVKSRFPGQRIGYPRIGAGLAGGDWEKIEKIIVRELDGENHTLVEYSG